MLTCGIGLWTQSLEVSMSRCLEDEREIDVPVPVAERNGTQCLNLGCQYSKFGHSGSTEFADGVFVSRQFVMFLPHWSVSGVFVRRSEDG